MSATATTRPTPSLNGSAPSWAEANQACLLAEFARLREQMSGGSPISVGAGSFEMEPASAIDQLTEAFGLTTFERDVLLLCAGVEMDSALAEKCAQALGSQQRLAPTFGLALASLAEPHWSALTPAAPLRRFRLIHIDTAHGLTTAPLRIDERILHFLAGINQTDARLGSFLAIARIPEAAAEEHQLLAARLAPIIAVHAAHPRVLHLCGDDTHGQ
ncbi:MAG TPA: ATP-binding protein, partial [Terracidiphilus sp.]